ncbi:MAG: sirohydrochlorin cobaltochelatase [Firmicutes bacterium]|nr:sirohydrochlorin cobaltochelatase [Bacillota bacterium]
MIIKRAILFVTFGGIRPEVREPLGAWFISEGADRWPDRWIEMVSGAETLQESLEELGGNGFGEVVVQPLLINNGNEYEKIRIAVNRFVSGDTAPMKVRLGKPLLWDHTDMERLAGILGSSLEATIYVAHGTGGSSDETFRLFDRKFRDIPWNITFVGTMKGAYGPEQIAERLEAKTVTLKPLMLTAGTHAKKDLAGDGEQSWKHRLEALGFDVKCEMIGLGELPAVRAMFLDHAAEATLIRRNSNPLEALVLAARTEQDPPLTEISNSLGLDESKILACIDMRQALMIQELQAQELFPDCELELVEGDLAAVIAMIDDCRSEYGGVIIGYGELQCLGLEYRARAIFTQEEIVPPMGAGSVNVVEAMAMQGFLYEIQEPTVEGEEPQPGTDLITTVYAEGDQDGLELWALYYDESSGQWWTDWITGDPEDPMATGKEFAIQIRQGGQWADGDDDGQWTDDEE